MYNRTVANNPELYHPLDLDKMKALIEKAAEERKNRPEAILMSETTWMNLRDFTPLQKTPEGLMGICGSLVGMPIFSIPDSDARLIPLNLEEVKNGEAPKFMGTDNVLAGSIESIQKILRWLDLIKKPREWRPWMKFRFDAAVKENTTDSFLANWGINHG